MNIERESTVLGPRVHGEMAASEDKKNARSVRFELVFSGVLYVEIVGFDDGVNFGLEDMRLF